MFRSDAFSCFKITMSNRPGGRLGPPPRWLRCPRKGQICAEKFVPFKVPLKEEYDDMVPEDCRFYPDMLFTDEFFILVCPIAKFPQKLFFFDFDNW